MKIAFCLLVLLAAETTWAHAVLVRSSPPDQAVLSAPPGHAVLRFNGRIERQVSQVVLLDQDGKKVELPVSVTAPGSPDTLEDTLEVPLPALAPGKYRLQYRVLAVDGHTTPGMIRFTVLKRGAS